MGYLVIWDMGDLNSIKELSVLGLSVQTLQGSNSYHLLHNPVLSRSHKSSQWQIFGINL